MISLEANTIDEIETDWTQTFAIFKFLFILSYKRETTCKINFKHPGKSSFCI